ncbi:hypothetical protein THORNTON_21 [Bacillus phage Thornton]|uniref:Uncharacterized protein n=1 Tax=Bacillus phage Thornton TaxID=2795746 RepID=A0A7T7GT83_9CAUD|nr:hypothetical protein KNV72_gp21 [Bacillus phage Thornton]QQM15012.1 hypothetical protein THORNTON_21 [Bacillus phage Thornton]
MKRREREFMIQKKKYIKASRFGKLIMSLNCSKWFTKLTKRKRKN